MNKVCLVNEDAWNAYFEKNIRPYRDNYNYHPTSYPCIIIHDIIGTSYGSFAVYDFVYPHEFE